MGALDSVAPQLHAGCWPTGSGPSGPPFPLEAARPAASLPATGIEAPDPLRTEGPVPPKGRPRRAGGLQPPARAPQRGLLLGPQ